MIVDPDETEVHQKFAKFVQSNLFLVAKTVTVVVGQTR